MTQDTGDTQALRQILEVTRKLAAPFDLDTMLTEVVDASREVLKAERGTVFLYDEASDELVVRVGTELDQIRIPADKGIVGESAQTRELINVPDCYADPRFNRAIDKQTGYTTRCMLTIPLIGYEDSLVGVLQILNKIHGVFDEQDEYVGQALAAQAAVGGAFAPTDQTGGDLYDFVPLADQKLFLLMGDASGHGIGPALSATQVRAMLRVALRLESSLDDAFMHINDQLCDDLPDDRFVTGFFGLLDGETHTIRFHSGGQGPVMHYQAEMGEYEWHPATTFPLGYMHHSNLDPPEKSLLDPGDIFGLISDGIYEYENEAGVQFGRQGVMKVLDENLGASAQELVDRIMAAAREHGGTAPQADDITIVLVRRLPGEADRDAT